MIFPSFSVADEVRRACPDLRLGLLYAEVLVSDRSAGLHHEIEGTCREIASSETPDSIKNWPEVAASREAYKRLGKDPSRYRPSAEALLRRVVSVKDLYQINNAVDSLNLVSLKTGFSIGGYDLDKLMPPIQLARGGEGWAYEGIGRGLLNLEALPVLVDKMGSFGSPTSDSMRSAVSTDTRRFLWVIFDFNGKGQLHNGLDMGELFLSSYASASNCLSNVF